MPGDRSRLLNLNDLQFIHEEASSRDPALSPAGREPALSESEERSDEEDRMGIWRETRPNLGPRTLRARFLTRLENAEFRNDAAGASSAGRPHRTILGESSKLLRLGREETALRVFPVSKPRNLGHPCTRVGRRPTHRLVKPPWKGEFQAIA